MRGSFKKHPDRKRPDEPQVDIPFPSKAPGRLTKEQTECWDEIVRISPAGVLTGADPITVEIVACLLAEFRRGPDKMDTPRLGRLCIEIGRLGLSPTDRAKLVVVKKKGNKFD